MNHTCLDEESVLVIQRCNVQLKDLWNIQYWVVNFMIHVFSLNSTVTNKVVRKQLSYIAVKEYSNSTLNNEFIPVLRQISSHNWLSLRLSWLLVTSVINLFSHNALCINSGYIIQGKLISNLIHNDHRIPCQVIYFVCKLPSGVFAVEQRRRWLYTFCSSKRLIFQHLDSFTTSCLRFAGLCHGV